MFRANLDISAKDWPNVEDSPNPARGTRFCHYETKALFVVSMDTDNYSYKIRLSC